MGKRVVLGTVAIALGVLFSSAASATFVQGSIGFAGGGYFTEADGTTVETVVADAKGIDILPQGSGAGGFALVGSSDLASITGVINATDFLYDPDGSPYTGFFSQGITFSFDLIAITDITYDPLVDPKNVLLKGIGVIHMTGFDDTSATWQFHAGSLGEGLLTWDSQIKAVPGNDQHDVPEPMSIALLGAGVAISGAVVRRRKKKSA